jgi:2-polyprenyl-6-methoxyphenol hydroxylase-like FAD-dependent oxidoreductase
VPELLEAEEASNDMHFGRVGQIHLPYWSANRVALVGDAADRPLAAGRGGTGLGMLEATLMGGRHRADGNRARGVWCMRAP